MVQKDQVDRKVQKEYGVLGTSLAMFHDPFDFADSHM
jgi:hypothetical protein